MVIMGTATTQAADIFTISLSYCDTPESTKYIQMQSATTYLLCYTLTNKSDTPVEVLVDFVDGTNTYDQLQHKACLDAQHKEMFGKYVTGYTSKVSLKAWESKQETAMITYPKDMQGTYQGCIVYALREWAKPMMTPEGINVVLRKGKFIELHVDSVGNWKTLPMIGQKTYAIYILLYILVVTGIVSARYGIIRKKPSHH